MCEAPFIDFAALERPDKPNNWLIAPMDHPASHARPDQAAPVYPVPAPHLATGWRQVVEMQPRTRVIATSDDGLHIEAEQKSAVFGFVDRISAQIIPLQEHRSTLAVYSRSLVGYWDMGVNRQRLGDWLAKLESAVDAHP